MQGVHNVVTLFPVFLHVAFTHISVEMSLDMRAFASVILEYSSALTVRIYILFMTMNVRFYV
jgi:hypothetical protein